MSQPGSKPRRIRADRRGDRPRARVIGARQMTRRSVWIGRLGRLEFPLDEDREPRPLTRGECREMPRPCPFVSCKHHLYLDVNPETGSIKINFPYLEPWELEHSCSLDIAEAGGKTLEEIGLITNLTRERVRQVEVRGLLTLAANRVLVDAKESA